MKVDGTDYLTGEKAHVSELRFLTAEDDAQTQATKDSTLFPEMTERPDHFARFAAKFVYKYGVARRAEPPVLLTDESLETVLSIYESTDGEMNVLEDNPVQP